MIFNRRIVRFSRNPAAVFFYIGLFCVAACFITLDVAYADDSASSFLEFDDTPLKQDIILPSWFKLSFLELKEDLKDVNKKQKRGLILYFGQRDCAYCKEHLEKNWGDRGIVAYTRKYFDVVAIDVRGDRPVADFNGKVYNTEKSFAAAKKTNFTPSILFYDLKGKEVFRLSGYHPPYQFRAALEYVVDKYYKKENFRTFLALGERPSGYDESDLIDETFFSRPPYALDRSRFPGATPLAVFFEEPTCYACNVLHNGPLKGPKIKRQLQSLESVQLDITANTPVLTPSGEHTTAKQWAKKLGIYYAPTIVFFDTGGKEILRIDSVVRFYRLTTVLNYIITGGYKEIPNFQHWRMQKKR